MRHFYLDFIFTAIALAIAAWWGYSHGGMGGLIATLSITAILAVMEISLSFDNAVVNASVLKGWDEFWKKIFLTVEGLNANIDTPFTDMPLDVDTVLLTHRL